MRLFAEIKETLSGPQGVLIVLSVPEMLTAIEISNAMLRASESIELLGILSRTGSITVIVAGEIGYLSHATNMVIQDLGDRADQVKHTIIVRPHKQLLDWLEQSLASP